MEIKRIGENKIRCALTETEIQEMGFDIEDIIGNSETTQRFMRVVLRLVEEQEHISLENVSPMVKAELLQDHTMAITFGGDSDLSFKSLVDTVNHLMSQLKPDKLEDFKNMSLEEKQNAVDEFLEGLHVINEKDADETAETEKTEAEKTKDSTKQSKKKTGDSMICALRFADMDSMIRMSRVCFPERVPKSSLYKLEGAYYLVLDFTGFQKEEMRSFAFGAVEYDDVHYSESAQIAYIQEHGKNIMKIDALQTLMEL